MMILTPIGWSR